MKSGQMSLAYNYEDATFDPTNTVASGARRAKFPQTKKQANRKRRDEKSRPAEDMTFLYADICGFTAYCATHSAEEAVNLVTRLFAKFDEQAVKLGVYKVFEYMCVCVYIYVYIYICIYIYIYIHTHTHTHTYAYAYAYAYVWMDGWMYVCMHACMYVRTYVCMYVCMYVFMYVSLSLSIYIYIERERERSAWLFTKEHIVQNVCVRFCSWNLEASPLHLDQIMSQLCQSHWPNP